MGNRWVDPYVELRRVWLLEFHQISGFQHSDLRVSTRTSGWNDHDLTGNTLEFTRKKRKLYDVILLSRRFFASQTISISKPRLWKMVRHLWLAFSTGNPEKMISRKEAGSSSIIFQGGTVSYGVLQTSLEWHFLKLP